MTASAAYARRVVRDAAASGIVVVTAAIAKPDAIERGMSNQLSRR